MLQLHRGRYYTKIALENQIRAKQGGNLSKKNNKGRRTEEEKWTNFLKNAKKRGL
jgi:hypothetical protein